MFRTPNKRARLYISGKVTGDRDFKNKFAAAEGAARRFGFRPVNPCKQPEGKEWSWYMKRDIRKLLGCDAILLLPDWRESRGAKLERRIAEELGLKRFVLVRAFGNTVIAEEDVWEDVKADE